MHRSIRSSTQLARAAAPAASPLLSRTAAPASRLVRAAGTQRRLASTAASASKRTWKGAAARWGVAGAALYWYNTSPIFADEAAKSPLAAAADAATNTDPSVTGASSPVPEENFRTVDALLEEKHKEAARRRAEEDAKKAAEEKQPAEGAEGAPPAPGSPEDLEAEAGQQGAFNPETGEINWDCPCLGGMAHGPCGEDFKAAFSCFVFSTEEPKGMDCIDKFQHMQDCFRQYPEIYGSELQDDEEEEGAGPAAAPGDVADDKPATGAPTKAQIAEKLAETEAAEKPKTGKGKTGKTKKTEKTGKAEKPAKPESIPAAATDATASNADPPAVPEPAAAPAPAPPAADDRSLPTAAFDATGANK